MKMTLYVPRSLRRYGYTLSTGQTQLRRARFVLQLRLTLIVGRN